jgi:N-hydroxyarylamine O-acetyltransferase
VPARAQAVTDAVAAYLARLYLEAEPPSVEALHRLVAAHARYVPYETVWLYLGEPRGISRGESHRHLVGERRGGYCYHLNGAFSRLLQHLGYDARLHRSTVHGPEAPLPTQRLNHAALLVYGLPDETNPGGRWLADVGLGDGPTAALPVVDGAHRNAPFTWRIGPPEHPGFEIEVRHDPMGTFDRFGVGTTVTSMRPFLARHRWLSTSPLSGFRRAVVVQRREGSEVIGVRGLVFSRFGGNRRHEATIDDAASWFGLLADEFGIWLSAVPRTDRQRLWRTVAGQHERWLAAEALSAT